jgi:hypothetical protein
MLKDSSGKEIKNNFELSEGELSEGEKISCEAESDPQSVVSLTSSDGAVKDVSDPSCELKSETDFWLCSVTATLVKPGMLLCKATMLGKDYCAGGKCEGVLPRVSPQASCGCHVMCSWGIWLLCAAPFVIRGSLT